MSPKEKLFTKEYAKQLVRLAGSDLAAASALINSKGIRSEIILFHLQQCVEKCLKAKLCWEEKAIPIYHDLLPIIQKIDQAELPPHHYELNDLTPFASIRRYVEGVEIISDEDIRLAKKMAEETLVWIKKIVPS